jgi:hypothetical protein
MFYRHAIQRSLICSEDMQLSGDSQLLPALKSWVMIFINMHKIKIREIKTKMPRLILKYFTAYRSRDCRFASDTHNVIHSLQLPIGLFRERSTRLPRRKFLSSRGGEKKLFLIIGNVFGHPKGVGGLTSNFLCGGGIYGCFLE